MSEPPMAYDDAGNPLWIYDEQGHPMGPGFVMSDYTRQQALASVGPGWAKLVGALWDFCKSLSPPIHINQVKEKYGTLCFYIAGVSIDRSDMVYTLISGVERLSAHICEVCGQQGKLRGRGWYYTSCNEHANPEHKDQEDD